MRILNTNKHIVSIQYTCQTKGTSSSPVVKTPELPTAGTGVQFLQGTRILHLSQKYICMCVCIYTHTQNIHTHIYVKLNKTEAGVNFKYTILRILCSWYEDMKMGIKFSFTTNVTVRKSSKHYKYSLLNPNSYHPTLNTCSALLCITNFLSRSA